MRNFPIAQYPINSKLPIIATFKGRYKPYSMQELLSLLAFYALFFLTVGIFQVLYKRFNVEAEVTRKLLHLSGGILALCVPFFLHDARGKMSVITFGLQI